MKRGVAGALLACLWATMLAAQERGVVPRHVTAAPPAVRHYVVYRAPTPLAIDGRLDEPAWRGAAWTADFVDILGDGAPTPALRTRAKLLWDDHYLYIGAELTEPDLWATLTHRDAVIFHDDDFEVFIDPDGDTQQYFELEINALNTVWDLLLEKAYRDGGPPVNAWNITGMESAVGLHGTLNDPADRDSGWTVELALPWRSLSPTPGSGHAPRPGDHWRLTFSRVEWHVDTLDGRYVKRADPRTDTQLPEENWVWSPQGAINMHMPEMWGVLQFAGADVGPDTVAFHPDPEAVPRWTLRRVYYAERTYHAAHDAYAGSLAALSFDPPLVGADAVRLDRTATGYEARTPAAVGRATWHIRQDGRIWK
ncbi:MAG TPA: carbohydrate-binding family 9-like protein [Gemmatimonadales bacterium]|nr:carbohydrate-binding family 9-like protein [Gemmatimonadales bacterium]